MLGNTLLPQDTLALQNYELPFIVDFQQALSITSSFRRVVLIPDTKTRCHPAHH